MDYRVFVTDHYHGAPAGAADVVCGFPSVEVATEYARRRTRASVEELRSPGQAAEDVRSAFLLYGESSAVLAGSERVYDAGDELDYFVRNPASAEQRDWISLEPGP
jgi:hypothetical protein